jgi:polysaccharide export outer membrane protein
LIYPGDVLDVTLITGAEKETPEPLPYRVTPRGMLELPLVGEIKVAGLTLTGAEEAIRTESINRRVYRSPIVSVLMNTRQADRVLVVGAVKEPKVYELPRAGSDLLAAITEAGGLTEDAGTIIEIRHPAKSTKNGVSQASFATDLVGESGELPNNATLEATSQTSNSVHVDLVEAMAGKAADLSLNDGSVVWVKEHRPETIYVQGLVKEAGEFELPKDKPLRVHQAIALAKGRTIEFADKIHITRFLEAEQEPIVIEVSWNEAKSDRDANIVLMPGDVVSVEETPQTFAADFLRNFFRVGFTSSIPGF